MTSKCPPIVSHVPVVAIGASAGGREAFVDLLSNLSPTTGLAYAYIEHAHPSSEPKLVVTLSQATPMPVLEANHLMAVEPDHVYIIPPDIPMEIVDGVLTRMPRRRQTKANAKILTNEYLPVDQFFTSLAERQKEGSVGVILSGLANDGTQGLKAIKVAGGITFAQDGSAKYLTMPQAAIVEGVVDRVLSPADIAAELERLSQQPALFQQTELVEMKANDLQTIIQWLKKTIGVDFSHYNMATIRRRIIRRMVLYKLDTMHAYANYLQQNDTEAILLYNDLLINITSFFRDPETMLFLKKTIFPQLIRQKESDHRLRIWVPGCSTGQEAYSLAMLLLEVLDELGMKMAIQIFATDLSEIAINRARQGTYTPSEVATVSPDRLQRFFTKIDGVFRIAKTVRDMCIFTPHNIFKDPPFSRVDLISCRNLLIHLNTVLQRNALIMFHYALNANGYLLLGKSETVSASVSLFTPADKLHKVFNRKDELAIEVISQAVVDRSDGQSAARLLDIKSEGSSNYPLNKARKPVTDLDKVVDQVLLNHYVPASVVVDQELDILQFRGETSLFLEHASGKASLNLLTMARPALSFEIRNSVQKARKSGQSVHRSGLEIEVSGRKHLVAIDVVPLTDGAAGRLFLILFQELDKTTIPESGLEKGQPSRTHQLENELAIMREEMHAFIEEHEIANEELQLGNEEIVSSNEELQSINEELETCKEEIESTNEKLQTINYELQVRNDQLTEAYMYAEAIFSTIREATLVLDKNLRVKSANQTFYQLFRLSESATVGKMIYEIGNHQWDIPQLRELLEEVTQKNAFMQGFEVKHHFADAGEKVMLIHARRVIHQQRQEAILLVIEDITEHRKVQQLLEERQIRFHDIIDNVPALIWVAGADGRYNFFNKVWLDYTGRSAEGKDIQDWTQGIHPEDRAGYIAAYITSFNGRFPYQAEYRLKRSDGEYRWMMENARPTFSPEGTFTGYIGTCAEVHVQKSLNQKLDNRVQERTAELTLANEKLAQTNNDLRNSADNLQAVLDTSPASVGLFKALKTAQGEVIDFSVVVCNQKFAQLVQEPIRQVAGKRATDLAATLWQEKTLPQLRQVYETGKSAYREQQEVAGRQDQWIGMYITRQDDGIMLTGVDITPLKQAEYQQSHWLQELERSQQAMQDLEQMRRYVRERGEFLRTTSHDLRGSFGVIQGAAALLNLMDTEEEREQMLSMLNRNLSQVIGLLTQLMDYSRLEAGQEQVFNQPFDVAELLRELSASLQPMAHERGLWLHINGPDSLPAKDDIVKVRRIAQNLVLNALTYTKAGGVTIGWSTGKGKKGWQFSVQDTGSGLPERSVRQLLDKHRQAETIPDNQQEQENYTDSGSGEGIGLSIVKQLSNLLNATLQVESTDAGTLIEVLF
ncbi:CheR family methyltransferase [Spirosoma pollinicola]|uniref:Chemotaxis protein CheR n=1 Tax=Spirosoma pollinicola TaxID=2057025 RepID=A0A2K8Z6L6_9BACT|nr:CheR family methyltransferase [Spirosoma pollinicola]AUD05469.1 chemotaxis protein CheR [Spirosoma pollinicola]